VLYAIIDRVSGSQEALTMDSLGAAIGFLFPWSFPLSGRRICHTPQPTPSTDDDEDDDEEIDRGSDGGNIDPDDDEGGSDDDEDDDDDTLWA
jgi:hypothetical protein